MSAAPIVEISGVHKAFDHVEVLKGIDLDVDRGQVVCMLGPSGSGKTTLLRCVNHLEKIDRGTIRVDGQSQAGAAVEQQPQGDRGFHPGQWCAQTVVDALTEA